MKIGIIAAMSKELDLLLAMMENTGKVVLNDITFHTGRIAGREIIAMQSGIGKVNAAVAAVTLIDSFHPSLVINSGVAGGTGSVGIGRCVIPSRISYHDVWCGPGTQRGQADGCPLYFECPLSPETVREAGAETGLLVSGDIFVMHADEVARILEIHPDAVAVDMESAAIAQVCYIKNVPFVVVRVISDTPGGSDNFAQYEGFWTEAPLKSFGVLTSLLRIL